jgi:hypothetical protein
MRDENEVRQRVRGPLLAVTLLSATLIVGAITALFAQRNRARAVDSDEFTTKT